MIAKGKFELTMHRDPPYDDAGGVVLAHARLEKRFSGALEATSQVHMISAHSAMPTSAAYVAVEKISGTLDGRPGSFTVVHLGIGDASGRSLRIEVVPDSGTEALAGIRGTMAIDIVDGQHFYTVEYGLSSSAP
jgi:hypothetical protein